MTLSERYELFMETWMSRLDWAICWATGIHGVGCRGRYCPSIPDLEAQKRYDLKKYRHYTWPWWKIWWRNCG